MRDARSIIDMSELISCTKELWKSDSINLTKGQEPSLDLRPDTSMDELVPIRSTVPRLSWACIYGCQLHLATQKEEA